MLRAARHQVILDSLHAHGPTSVTDLAERTGASEATIRRDLAEMDSAGLLRRVHGGALEADATSAAPSSGAAPGTSPGKSPGTRPATLSPAARQLADEIDRPFHEVAADNAAAKDAIAQRAAQLVRDGATVFLDIGTTCQRVAAALHGRRITVITSSLAVLEELREEDTIDLVLLGGMVRRRYHSMVGFLTEEAIRSLHADQLFLSTSGVSPDGRVMDTTGIEVPIKRAMIEASDQVILVADADKFPGERGAVVCPVGSVDILVTDSQIDETTCSTLIDAGVEVLRA